MTESQINKDETSTKTEDSITEKKLDNTEIIKAAINNKIYELRNIESEITNLFAIVKKLKAKQKINVLFLWLIWILVFSIFLNEDFRVLFFSNLNNATLIFMLTLFFFLVLIETLNVLNIKNQNSNKMFSIIIFLIYFIILILSSLKSLIFIKGFGWQFYLLLLLTNFSLIISKIDIIYSK